MPGWTSTPLVVLAMSTLLGCTGSSSEDGDAGIDATAGIDAGATRGAEGGVCYPNGTCDAGLACDRGVCARDESTPGSLGGTCDSSLPCTAALSCPGGRCVDPSAPAGGLGADCAASGACGAELACRFGVCLEAGPAAGTRGGACLGDGTCDAGLLCRSGRCEERPAGTPMTEAEWERVITEWRRQWLEECDKERTCNPDGLDRAELDMEYADCMQNATDPERDEPFDRRVSVTCADAVLALGRCVLALECAAYATLNDYWNGEAITFSREDYANAPHCAAEGVEGVAGVDACR